MEQHRLQFRMVLEPVAEEQESGAFLSGGCRAPREAAREKFGRARVLGSPLAVRRSGGIGAE